MPLEQVFDTLKTLEILFTVLPLLLIFWVCWFLASKS
jgi:hypothetical protein